MEEGRISKKVFGACAKMSMQKAHACMLGHGPRGARSAHVAFGPKCCQAEGLAQGPCGPFISLISTAMLTSSDQAYDLPKSEIFVLPVPFRIFVDKPQIHYCTCVHVCVFMYVCICVHMCTYIHVYTHVTCTHM